MRKVILRTGIPLAGVGEGTPVLVSLRVNHGDPNEMVPWLAFPALSPCEADKVWVLVHILQTSLQMHA